MVECPMLSLILCFFFLVEYFSVKCKVTAKGVVHGLHFGYIFYIYFFINMANSKKDQFFHTFFPSDITRKQKFTNYIIYKELQRKCD